jgi:hypothetical protein
MKVSSFWVAQRFGAAIYAYLEPGFSHRGERSLV